MKTLSQSQLDLAAGPYTAPEGYYRYIKSLPFLGSLTCNVKSLIAGQWTEVLIVYTVGGSGLADGAWIKGTFKFYSDWALFQTTDPTKDNYVSAEYAPTKLVKGQTPATVQDLAVRFDQKGHERPFQKAIIIDIVDGYINPGDKIIIRLGDRRLGARGTRAQTFVEDNFLMRWYIDPVGTSRFAAIKPDISIDIQSGPIHHLKIQAPRLVRPNVFFQVLFHAEDQWGNTTTDIADLRAILRIYRISKQRSSRRTIIEEDIPVAAEGWSYGHLPKVQLNEDGEYLAEVVARNRTGLEWTASEYISVDRSSPVPRVLYGDLHVHSDDTVGTNSSAYNFSYAQKIAGLDVIGYTANDFHITADRWASTLSLIREINKRNEVLIFPGTEWCGNSAAGGDHNVVFLDDTEHGTAPEFPFDRHGNVARSFEWNENGPAELQPGAWPLDEVYATYAHAAETHLMIPHVGGRRCNLGWHHPKLERLVEIGSAWGLFEWLLEDAVKRGWKMGVCANSDEHRGRCGGGVPGTAVFGTKGGLTGILAESLDRKDVATALRSRRTFATTGERLVGLAKIVGEKAIQGDDFKHVIGKSMDIQYAFYGTSGFSSIEAFDASGRIFHRDLWREEDSSQKSAQLILRVTWGGARLYDRYKEAVWDGTISTTGGEIERVAPFGGISYIPEEQISQVGGDCVSFNTHTSGDYDGVNIYFGANHPTEIIIMGELGGYVKVGDVLKRNSHKAQPAFKLRATWQEALQAEGKSITIKGGAGLFVTVRAIPDIALPERVEGVFRVNPVHEVEDRSIYFVGREWNGGKVITSPIFIQDR